MSANDIILINAVVGAVVVPPLVQFLKGRTWSDAYKRILAFVLCLAIAGGEYLAVGNHLVSFAISAPVLFSSATTAYHLFFQDKLGALTELQPLAGVINPPAAP